MFADYQRLSAKKAYLEELSTDMGIPMSELVQVIKGGEPSLQGTWVHPQVAINLGHWLNTKFAVLVSKWFFEWVSGNIQPKTEIPYHIRRYIANRSEVPFTHFSMLNELIFGLIAPLEGEGYTLPGSLMPDISEGKMFFKLAEKGKAD
ncbi:MAG: KilA-N domain-containing protein [Candidatus Melainabacteria bacterium]|nr:KilA-N domain-containing protein [Candidatus Melainabacteria bacterium]